MTKQQLRIKYKKLRSDIECRAEKAEIIGLKLTKSSMFKNCKSIFLYSASGTEVATDTIAKAALAEGKSVAYPVCVDRDGNMEFYFINSLQDLSEGMYGIKEPDTEKCKMAVPDENTLIVAPALAFDKKGFRLGYGKGYYDRYLENYRGYSAGLAYDECICDCLPVSQYDKKINCLISDKNTYIFNTAKEE